MWKQLLECRIMERLNEMTTAFRDKRAGYLIQVNPDICRQGDEYFKIFDSTNERRAKKMARILFRKPEYVYHSNNRGKEIWMLNSKEKRYLMDILHTQNEDDPNITNWQNIILAYNFEKGLAKHRSKENLLSSGKLKYSRYLPYDLEIPDYTLLK